MAAISGTFKTSARYIGYRPPADNSRNWGTGVDPDHGRSDLPDLGFPSPVEPAFRNWTPPYLEDYFDPAADDLPYLPQREQEPAGHDVPSVPSGYIRDDASQAANGAARMVGRGANTSVGRPTGRRDYGETNVTEMRRSLPPLRGEPGPLTGQALRALRGRNSLEVNNPGSPEVSFSGNYVRQGQEIYRLTNRPMPRRGLSHTKRPLYVNVAATAIDSPGVESPYSSAFSSAPNMSVGPPVPFLRRQPRPMDEDAVQDGTELYEEPITRWGL